MRSIINPGIEFSNSCNEYQQAEPFPHCVFDNFLRADVVDEVARTFPGLDEHFWYLYNNPLEKKFTCDRLEHIPVPIKHVLELLNSNWFLKALFQLTRIPGLNGDPDLRGGGIHCTPSGGKLDVHLDSNIHVKSGLERRINLIIYVSKNWEGRYGGAMELWDRSMSEKVKSISPNFNRAVIFDVGGDSFHGVPDAIKCPSGITRRSLNVYYYTELREDVIPRYRAQFYKRPQDPDIPAIQKLREHRAGRDSAESVWRTDG